MFSVASTRGKVFQPGGVAAPPLPDIASVITLHGLWNLNNAGNPAGQGIAGATNDFFFTASSPYPLDWTDGASQAVAQWISQNIATSNDLLASGTARPTLDVTNHEIDFDGTTDGLASANAFADNSRTASFFLLFKAASLVETSVLFETGATGTAAPACISVRMVAGVLTVSVSDETPVTPLLNTKIKTISDSDYHVLSVVVDTELAAASQVQIWVDGSQTGVTAPLSSDLAAERLLNENLFVGARNQASVFFTGSMRVLAVINGAVSTGQREAWETYLTYLIDL